MCEACETARKVLVALAEEAARQGYDIHAAKRYDNSGEYASGIEAAARQYWKDGSRGGFITRMKEVTKFGLQTAFRLGAEAVGIPEDELTEQELTLRDEIIKQEQSHIADLLDYIDQAANTPETPLSSLSSRLSLWTARYEDVINRAKVLAGKDAKLEWVYGDTEHCDSCRRLNGIVKRSSFWQKAGVMPRNPPNAKLDCGGWKCQCTLTPTDKPLRRGGLPRLP